MNFFKKIKESQDKDFLLKDLELEWKSKNIEWALSKLDPNNFYIFFWKNDFCFYNLYHYPLLIFTKLNNFICHRKKKYRFDHVCCSSRFIIDTTFTPSPIFKTLKPLIFEFSIDDGMHQEDLISKIRKFKGKIYIKTINSIVLDKEKAMMFEYKYRNVPYNKLFASLSGLDNLFKKLRLKKDEKPKGKGGFCSWGVIKQLQYSAPEGHFIHSVNAYSIDPTECAEIINQGDDGKFELFYQSAI